MSQNPTQFFPFPSYAVMKKQTQVTEWDINGNMTSQSNTTEYWPPSGIETADEESDGPAESA